MNEFKISKKLKESYDDYYLNKKESNWRRVGSYDKARNIVELCSQYPHSTILEIGVGEGSNLERLCELDFGKELYGLDVSHSGVEVTKQKKIPKLVEVDVYDGYNIPYEDDKFDLAVLSHVIEHVEHPRKLLYEAARVAKYVFVEVPLQDNFKMPKDFVFRKLGHINFYSSKSIRWLLQSCNLEVISQKTTNPSRNTYRYRYGNKGFYKFLIKEIVLRIIPNLGTKILQYNSSLVAKRRS